jgi:hypothetical protein
MHSMNRIQLLGVEAYKSAQNIKLQFRIRMTVYTSLVCILHFCSQFLGTPGHLQQTNIDEAHIER